MSRENSYHWHEMNTDDVLQKLDVHDDSGLTAEEAINRQEQYGKNKLTGAKKESKFKKFIKQFNDMLIYVLLVAAIITTILGHMIDTIVILAEVIINALIGYLQENKAEKALDAIKNMLSLHA